MSFDLSDPQLSTSAVRLIDRQCDAFESAWNSGKRPRIEDFLAGRSGPELSHLFRELLKIDVECRNRFDDQSRMTAADYCRLFPDREREIEAVFSDTAQRPVADQYASTMSMLSGNAPRQIDKYKLLQRIGRGGMGEVYTARHVPLNRTVALKLINARQVENPQAVSRFKREMQAVGKLNHPNIVNATDGGEVAGTHYLVMELVDGIDLARVVRRLGRLRIEDACEIARQASLGMAHAHEMGLIHRDLKPSNLMLDKNGTIKVLDMGLARLLEPGQNAGEVPTLTSSGQAMGTPEYMAPEQARNTTMIDQRVDIYSLGCTLYEFLTGQPPFPKLRYETPIGVLMAQIGDPPPPIELARTDLPPGLVEIVRNLLAKNPAERVATMNDVAALLEPFAKECNLVALLDQARQYPLGPIDSSDRDEESPIPAAPADSELPGKPGRFTRRQLLAVAGAGACAAVALAWSMWLESGTDLLTLVDPQRDGTRGNWRRVDGRLISPREGVAILRLPQSVPGEFDLEAVIDREFGLSLAIVNIGPSTPFVVRFETDVQSATDGGARPVRPQIAGAVVSASWPLHRQTSSRLMIEVRKRRLRVRLNDDPPMDWAGEYSMPDGLAGEFDLQRPGLYLRTEGSEFQFSRIRIIDRTGRS